MKKYGLTDIIKFTMEDFNKADKGGIIIVGEFRDAPPDEDENRLYLMGSNKIKKFVIVKGFGDDWTLYVEPLDRDLPEDAIAVMGDKPMIDTIKSGIHFSNLDPELRKKFRT